MAYTPKFEPFGISLITTRNVDHFFSSKKLTWLKLGKKEFEFLKASNLEQSQSFRTKKVNYLKEEPSDQYFK